MSQGGTIAQRITDLIGATYNTEAAYEGCLLYTSDAADE